LPLVFLIDRFILVKKSKSSKRLVSLSNHIEHLITPVLLPLGYEVVRVVVMGGERCKVQVMIDRLDSEPVNIEDCEKSSRQISALFDVNQVFPGTYVLEVSSPGLDRPLIKKKDFLRFLNHLVLVETHEVLNMRRKFEGNLDYADDVHIQLSCSYKEKREEKEKITIAYENIRQARLVFKL